MYRVYNYTDPSEKTLIYRLESRNRKEVRTMARCRKVKTFLIVASVLLVLPALVQGFPLLFGTRVDYAVGSQPEGIAADDFDGDGATDLATANYLMNTVSVLLGNGDGTYETSVSYPVANRPIALTSGLFDGDNIPDLAVADYWGHDVSILIGIGDGTFNPAVSYVVGTNPRSVIAADFDGDTILDLALTCYTVDSVSVLIGAGDGSFGAPV